MPSALIVASAKSSGWVDIIWLLLTFPNATALGCKFALS